MNPRLRARFERQNEEELRMTRRQRDELARLLPEGRVRFDELMSLHTSIGIGGPAEAFVEAENIETLKKVMEWALAEKLDWRFFGGGSNTLVRDGGLRGLVIKLAGEFNSMSVERESGGEVFVTVKAATPTQKFVRWCSENGFSGAEKLAGIWGTVGGNIATNAGNDAGAASDLVEEITIVTRDLRELTMKKSALKFEYRGLKIPSTSVIVRALLKFKKTSPEEVAGLIDAHMKKREATQPVGQKSLGCIFRNPGKTPAGVLIEEAGLKGVRVGGARVSPVHANFIVNEGRASARDVSVLVSLIRERVKENTGITLETEIEIIGKA